MKFPQGKRRRVQIGIAAGLLVTWLWPFHSALHRYGLLIFLVAAWIMAFRSIRQRWLGWPLLVLPLLLLTPFCLPGRAYPVAELKSDYLSAMKSMEGAIYIWGGENHYGIDCSGLPRRGLRDALWKEGWRHGNGAAFREWARQWWFDASARALAAGYRGYTRPLGITGVLRELDVSRIEPGDLAVTADGRHVMVYYGSGQWIQAEPNLFKVYTAKPADYPNSWFDNPVTMHRWALFSE